MRTCASAWARARSASPDATASYSSRCPASRCVHSSLRRVIQRSLGDPADDERTLRAFLAAAERARDAGAEVLVLGCAGMTGLQQAVGDKLGMPVVDGVGAAVRLAESLVGLGLTTSRAGGYAKPRPKARTWGSGHGAPPSE